MESFARRAWQHYEQEMTYVRTDESARKQATIRVIQQVIIIPIDDPTSTYEICIDDAGYPLSGYYWCHLEGRVGRFPLQREDLPAIFRRYEVMPGGTHPLSEEAARSMSDGR